MNQSDIVVKVENLDKSFDVVGGSVRVLKGISFEVSRGEFTIIYGPSGCGKSTLLHTVLGLEPPTAGKVHLFGRDLYEAYSEDGLADFRKANIGMVYQQPNWVKAINVIENVALPLALLGEERSIRMQKAEAMLKQVDMLDWALYHPSELSSGQQQKVALARALITNPKIIIADEPTGNLDFDSGNELMTLLNSLSAEQNATILMVTHDLEYLKEADKAVKLFDGTVEKVFSPSQDAAEMKKVNFKRKYYEEVAE